MPIYALHLLPNPHGDMRYWAMLCRLHPVQKRIPAIYEGVPAVEGKDPKIHEQAGGQPAEFDKTKAVQKHALHQTGLFQ
jgi:hypothetical protein